MDRGIQTVASQAGSVAGIQLAPTRLTQPSGELRRLSPQRTGVVRIPCELDSLIPSDHRARAIWKIVEDLDVSTFEAKLRARGSHPGRPPIDRRILIAVWIYGTSEGVYEARELDRLCKQHVAYLWLCGGVSVDYHLLSDFRVEHQEAINGLFDQIAGLLRAKGQLPLRRTAQDGMRVRASAGTSSFHRESTLQEHLQEAQQELQGSSPPVEDTLPKS